MHSAQKTKQKHPSNRVKTEKPYNFAKISITTEKIFIFVVDSCPHAGIYSNTLAPAMKCDVADTPKCVV